MIMAGLAYEVCLLYLDDVIVFSSSVEEHFIRLRLVVSKLRYAGRKFKLSKCSLLQKQVSLSGSCGVWRGHQNRFGECQGRS